MTLRTDHIPLVLFSGGLDSTYALIKALNEFEQVDTLHCKLETQDTKAQREYLATSAIYDVIRSHQDLYPDEPKIGKVRRRHIYTVPGTRGTANAGMLQPIAWMYAIASYMSNTEPCQEVWLGYVEGDGILPNIVSLSYSWDYLVHACEINSRFDIKPKLCFPLKHTTKEYILRSYCSRYLKHVTWCEGLGEENDCGSCGSCERMLKEAIFLKTFRPRFWENHPLKGRLQKLIDLELDALETAEADLSETVKILEKEENGTN